jgi:hypothetical protein
VDASARRAQPGQRKLKRAMSTPDVIFNRKFATLVSLAALGLWCATTTAHAAGCALDHSVFRDSGGQGFVLSFSETRSPHAQITARARITHPVRGTLFKFELGRTNGYGATYLTQTPLPGQDKADRQRPHGVYFLTNT